MLLTAVRVLPALSTVLLLSACALAVSTMGAARMPAPPTSIRVADAAAAHAVVQQLDAVMQPRFRLAMGQFGADRIGYFSPDGHPRVALMSGESRREQRVVGEIERMRRPYVVAMLHCAHRPGSHVGTHDASGSDTDDFGTTTVSCASSTDSDAERDSDWADQHLDTLTKPYRPTIVRGASIEVVAGKWLLAIHPVKTSGRTCVSCHVGARVGDTLGALVYMVHLKPAARNVNHYYPDGASEGV